VESANVELVRSIYAAWERGDFSESWWADPQIEFVIADGPSPGRWTGLVGMAQGAREFLSTWEDLRVDVEEYRELDAERVLVFGRNLGRGKASGLELGQMRTWGANVHHIRDGKVTKHVLYYDRDRALADLGLAPETGSPSANLVLVRSIHAAQERGDFGSAE
jgi:ketosteroid isomerase-like protein